VVLAVGPGAAEQQHLAALSVSVLTGQVQRRVSCLETDGRRFYSRRGDVEFNCRRAITSSGRNGGKPTLFLACALAPAFTSAFTDWLKPCQETSWSAALPS